MVSEETEREPRTEAICGTCLQPFFRGRSETWKHQCWDCYSNFKSFAKPSQMQNRRIRKMGYRSGLYIAHPSVTKEDVDAFARKHGFVHGWGAAEWTPEKWDRFKIFVIDENDD